MRALILLLAVHAAAFGAPQRAPKAAPHRDVSIELDGDYLRYSLDGKRAVLDGHVRIRIIAPGYTRAHTIVVTNHAEVDLVANVVTTQGGGKIVVGPAFARGDTMRFDAVKEDFSVHNADAFMALSVPDADPAAPPPMVYFKGEEIGKTGDVVYVLRGRITTCDLDNPHYYVSARRILYNVRTGEATIYSARLHLYGLNLPLIPYARTTLGGTEMPRSFDFVTMPGYSHREGLFLPYSLAFTPVGAGTEVATSFRLTTKAGITGAVWAKRSEGRWDFDVRDTRKEWQADVLNNELALSRMPELTAARHFTGRGNQNHELRLDLSVGRFQEDWEDQPVGQPHRPVVFATRALGAVTYTAHPRDYYRGLGTWYGARLSLSSYDTHQSLTDLRLFAGAGAALSPQVSGDVTLIHHLTGGSTPFLFDAPQITTELAVRGEWDFAPKWFVDGWGRYDAERGEMRDYEIGVNARDHCLTWGLYYRALSHGLGVRLDLTGITGRTKPYKSESRLQAEMEREGLAITAPAPGTGALTIQGPATPPAPPKATGSPTP